MRGRARARAIGGVFLSSTFFFALDDFFLSFLISRPGSLSNFISLFFRFHLRLSSKENENAPPSPYALCLLSSRPVQPGVEHQLRESQRSQKRERGSERASERKKAFFLLDSILLLLNSLSHPPRLSTQPSFCLAPNVVSARLARVLGAAAATADPTRGGRRSRMPDWGA